MKNDFHHLRQNIAFKLNRTIISVYKLQNVRGMGRHLSGFIPSYKQESLL